MALKNKLSVGQYVHFGRSTADRTRGKVVKLNPKTARIKVPYCGEFLVTYNLIWEIEQTPGGKEAVRRPAKKKTTAQKLSAAAKKRKSRRTTGKKVCAVPVKGPRAKKNPPPKLTRNQRLIADMTASELRHAVKMKAGAKDPAMDLTGAKKDKYFSEYNRFAQLGYPLVKADYMARDSVGVLVLRKKNPPYQYGQLSKKHRQESDWGEDTRGFHTTQPDLYEEEVTRPWASEQTRRNPSRGREPNRATGWPSWNAYRDAEKAIRELTRVGYSKRMAEEVLRKAAWQKRDAAVAAHSKKRKPVTRKAPAKRKRMAATRSLIKRSRSRSN